MDRLCPACETRQTFGVVMDPLPDGSHRCPECQYRWYPPRVDDPSDTGAAMEDDPWDARRRQKDAERAAAALDRLTAATRDREGGDPHGGWEEVYDADTSRPGRYVPEDAGGGGNGRIRKKTPNWSKWIRRGT